MRPIRSTVSTTCFSLGLRNVCMRGLKLGDGSTGGHIQEQNSPCVSGARRGQSWVRSAVHVPRSPEEVSTPGVQPLDAHEAAVHPLRLLHPRGPRLVVERPKHGDKHVNGEQATQPGGGGDGDDDDGDDGEDGDADTDGCADNRNDNDESVDDSSNDGENAAGAALSRDVSIVPSP